MLQVVCEGDLCMFSCGLGEKRQQDIQNLIDTRENGDSKYCLDVGTKTITRTQSRLTFRNGNMTFWAHFLCPSLIVGSVCPATLLKWCDAMILVEDAEFESRFLHIGYWLGTIVTVVSIKHSYCWLKSIHYFINHTLYDNSGSRYTILLSRNGLRPLQHAGIPHPANCWCLWPLRLERMRRLEDF